jgi:hypothetical protein
MANFSYTTNDWFRTAALCGLSTGFILPGPATFERLYTYDFMKELLQDLIQLQSLASSGVKDKNAAASLAELRAKIPSQILAHYDRLVARGKKGLAAVRGQVCSGCHMQVPLGVVMTLKRGEDIQICESCGRYLYLPPVVEPEATEPAASPKPARKKRKPKN